MKSGKTNAELLSEYVSKRMKEETQRHKGKFNPRKRMSDIRDSVNSAHLEKPQKFLNSSKLNKNELSSSQGIKRNETTNWSIQSKQSFGSFRNKEEGKDDFKDSQVETNSLHEKNSIWSMPAKLGENDTSNSQFL